jgi:hypothetical protein
MEGPSLMEAEAPPCTGVNEIWVDFLMIPLVWKFINLTVSPMLSRVARVYVRVRVSKRGGREGERERGRERERERERERARVYARAHACFVCVSLSGRAHIRA